MTWQIALALNLFIGAFRIGAQKKILGVVEPTVFLFWVLCYMLPLFIGIYIFQYGSLPGIYPEMFLLGIIFSISASCVFAATKISLSQTTVVGTYSIAISMILAALFLGESDVFTLQTCIGLAAAGISLYYLSQSKGAAQSHMTRHWLLLMICFIVTDGAGQFWNKMFLMTHTPLEALISQLIADIPFMYLLIRIRKIPFRISVKKQQWIALDSLLEVGFCIFLLTSYKIGPLTVILPIQKLGSIMAGLLLGILFFKEGHSYTKKKYIGLVIGLAGIILLII
jgi:uncharacterized membrane protein